ncbi:N-acetyltransferase [Arcobacter sp. LA11]|uniref:N-acetyltransferase n=1 Tax=Arcobacter sp. LA11 TaxID=1898176 RepID=UPI0009350071|nr:N-acetyltransferase [Arcobacter sp. LA11]
MSYLTLNKNNIKDEHICCAFSDKKCKESYEAKKTWIESELENGFVFEKLDQRAKVFLETIPSSKAWVPIFAPNFLYLGCFWVSGKYKKQGHGKALLENAINRCKKLKLKGLVTVVGKKKMHFMSDTKWLLKQGFEIVDETEDGFLLIVLNLSDDTSFAKFNDCVKKQIVNKNKCVVYYSNRCPFSEYHVLSSLKESCEKRGIDLEINKLTTKEEAQNCPSPATIFSMFYKGKFITTDISSCMDSRFDKFIQT